jgi:hypothetical protein
MSGRRHSGARDAERLLAAFEPLARQHPHALYVPCRHERYDEPDIF